MNRTRRIRSVFALCLLPLLAAPMEAARACTAVWARFASVQDYNATLREAAPVFLELGFEEEAACAGASISLTPTNGGSIRLDGPGGALDLETRSAEVGGGSSLRSTVDLREARGAQGGRSLEVFRIRPNQFVASGPYVREFDLLINGAPQSAAQPELRVFVAPVARFLTPEQPLRVDFGNLGADPFSSQGAARERPRGDVRFLYQATAPVTMLVTSRHDGKLVHEQGAELTPIAYEVAINGTSMPLGAQKEVHMRSGDRNPGLIEITLDQIGYRYAGNYEDRLTIQITGE
ncbi:hypothetical protein [Neomegalonema sp.]|uniref:hypothetical protein n=1 Tax=Neomegalonema sp. TaxID=2039713 RepID=UPI00262FAA9E|nr:hypothetical protein [Neomegalonema sp.]MDD2867697.1 hypothetical protein [Neomegalonema sp.]